jgi:hypothetical protein
VDEDDDHEHPELASYVDQLEAELDEEIAAIDSDYDSDNHESDIELDDTITPVDKTEIDDIHAAAA